VWLKLHYKQHTYVYTNEGKYATQDIFNLFDGICKFEDNYVWLQLSTNRLHQSKEYINESAFFNLNVLLLAPTTLNRDSIKYTGMHVQLICNGDITQDYYEEYSK